MWILTFRPQETLTKRNDDETKFHNRGPFLIHASFISFQSWLYKALNRIRPERRNFLPVNERSARAARRKLCVMMKHQYVYIRVSYHIILTFLYQIYRIRYSTYMHAHTDLALEVHILDMQRCLYKYVFGHSIEYMSCLLWIRPATIELVLCLPESFMTWLQRSMTEFGRQFLSMPSCVIPRDHGHMVDVWLRPLDPGLQGPQAVYQQFSRLSNWHLRDAFLWHDSSEDCTVTMPFSRWPACSASGISGLRKTTESSPLCTRVPRRNFVRWLKFL